MQRQAAWVQASSRLEPSVRWVPAMRWSLRVHSAGLLAALHWSLRARMLLTRPASDRQGVRVSVLLPSTMGVRLEVRLVGPAVLGVWGREAALLRQRQRWPPPLAAPWGDRPPPVPASIVRQLIAPPLVAIRHVEPSRAAPARPLAPLLWPPPVRRCASSLPLPPLQPRRAASEAPVAGAQDRSIYRVVAWCS